MTTQDTLTLDKLKEAVKSFDDRLAVHVAGVNKVNKELFDWYDANRKEIKKLYPKKGKIYRIIEPEKHLRYQPHLVGKVKNLYFKTDSPRFAPASGVRWGDHCAWLPTVEGEVLNEDLNTIIPYERVHLDDICEVDEETVPDSLKERLTNVYVMIDKNTGYYKIGRSINPRAREKTLQSEKPTIEMLFNHEAKKSDEKNLHEMFKDKRIRGEWFDLNGSDLTKIREYFNQIQL